MQEQDDGPSDPAKVAATITAALAAGMVKFPDAAAELRFRAKLDELSDAVKRSNEAIEALPVSPAVTHSNRPEVEVLIAGRHDLMVEADRLIDEISDRLSDWRNAADGLIDCPIPGPTLQSAADLLGRLGAYIVGQDERLIATATALSESQYHRQKNAEERDEAIAERKAAVEDRDKADAARGKAERDHAAILKGLRAGFEQFKAEQRAEVEGLKGDVRAAETAWDDEQAKRIKAEDALKVEQNRCAALEMRIEGAIFALRHGMNEGVEASEARFSPSTSLIDYLAEPLDGKAPTIPARGLYNDRTIETGVENLRESLRLLGMVSNGDRPDKLKAIVERQLLAAGLLPERHYKPRFRVVTSPRFYSDEDVERAIRAVCKSTTTRTAKALVDSFMNARVQSGYVAPLIHQVATALGMRRAAQ